MVEDTSFKIGEVRVWSNRLAFFVVVVLSISFWCKRHAHKSTAPKVNNFQIIGSLQTSTLSNWRKSKPFMSEVLFDDSDRIVLIIVRQTNETQSVLKWSSMRSSAVRGSMQTNVEEWVQPMLGFEENVVFVDKDNQVTAKTTIQISFTELMIRCKNGPYFGEIIDRLCQFSK